jgi:hypothetical protein
MSVLPHLILLPSPFVFAVCFDSLERHHRRTSLCIMGGNEADGYFTIQRALDIARNSEGVVDPTISSYLERALRDVWTRLEAAPESYILTKDEFALFNFFRHRFTTSNVAQGAVQRFWDNYQGDPREFQSATNGNTGS